MTDPFKTTEFKEAVYTQLGIQTGAGEVQIRCPNAAAHKNGDANPSASLNRENGLWVCYGCGARGNTYQLAESAGLEPKTMVPEATPESWQYASQDGTILMVTRYANKQFRQSTKKPGGTWVSRGLAKHNLALPLRHWELGNEDYCYIVEGEKDCEALWGLNLPATTCAGGAKAHRKTDWSLLAEKRLILIPDCDDPGREFAKEFTSIDAEIEIIDLRPHATKPGFDISDYLADHRDLSALIPIPPEEFFKKAEPEEPDPDIHKSAIHQLDWEAVSEPYEFRNASTLGRILEALDVPIRYEIRQCERQIQLGGKWHEIDEMNTAALRENIRNRCTVMKKGAPAPLDYGHDKGYWKECINALLYEDARRVDSFLEWLKSELPEWDEVPRIDTVLADLFEINQTPITAWASRYLFIGPIQRAFAPGAKLDEIPVFYGPQGVGKSTLIKEVIPESYRLEWHGEGVNFGTDEKRFIESLLGKVIVEASEMVGANRAENSLIKSMITRQVDTIRLTYAPHVSNLPRRCVIIGSTDSTEALPNDPAGNRRFVVIQLTEGANVEAYLDECRMQLWAEALFHHRRGMRANLPRDLFALRDQTNRLFRNVSDSLEATILDAAGQFSSLPFTLAQVKDRFPAGFFAADRVVGSALRNNGYIKKQVTQDGRRQWCYERKD